MDFAANSGLNEMRKRDSRPKSTADTLYGEPVCEKLKFI